MILSKNEAVKILYRKHLAQTFPSCYPQFWSIWEKVAVWAGFWPF